MATSTASNLVDADWSAQKGDECATTLGTVFQIVRDENEWRTDKDEFHWGLYEGTGLGGVRIKSRRHMTYASATLPDNVTKMAVDTLTAKVATIRPIPQVMANRGNWKDGRRARKMRQFIQGAFAQVKLHEEIAAPIIKDALVARGGVVQVYPNGKRLQVDRVHSWTLYFDEWDAEFGKPANCYRLRTMDRRRAVQKWAGKNEALADKIRTAGRLSSITSAWRDEERWSTVERVELLEAWHRCTDHDPDDENHKCDGKHVIMCDGAILEENPWPHDFFPFAILTYDTPNTGAWGTSLVQSLEGYQISINKANDKLEEMFDLSGVLVLLRDGGGVFKPDITNGLRVAHIKPGPYEPVIEQLDLVNEHLRMRPADLVGRALSSSGISDTSARGQNPAGIHAAIALQTLDDIESQRHIVFGRRFEAWCMKVAELMIEAIKKVAEKYGEYAVKVPMRGGYLPLKWADCEIDGFQLEMQSVGSLYMSFAGRLDKLKTLFEMGAIDRGTFMRQLDAGDLQAELDLETVDRLLVDEMIESMLDDARAANDNGDDTARTPATSDPQRGYVAPTPYLPLDWAHRRAHQKRLQAELEGAPEHVLTLLSDFIDDLQYLMDKRDAPAKAAQQQLQQPQAGTAMTTNLAAQPTGAPMSPTPGPEPMGPGAVAA